MLQPGNVRFQSNYAVLLLATGDLAGAYKAVRETTRLDPHFVPLTLANVLKASGYPERAIPYFHKSAELMPGYLDAVVDEAMAYLQIGKFESGWDLWEKRGDLDAKFKAVPFWDGGDVDRLLVHEDQGLGDIIQCLRYLPQLRNKAKTITLQVPAPLQKLLAAHFPAMNVLPHDAQVPVVDARVRFMSLPHHFKTSLDSIPQSVPYLRAEDAWQKMGRDRLSALAQPRIGLVWGGNPANHNDHNRSLAFKQIAPLVQDNAAHFVSLQKGVQKDQAGFAESGVFDACPFMKDFTDTAGLVAGLDLLISVDTATVHLAAAMGKPVWLLVPFDNDWRWMIARDDSPWYPSLRIFRQTKPGDWRDVIRRVDADMRKLIAGDRGVLKPNIWAGPPLRQNPNALPLPE
jgi:tetratricopeptide (TPR) repeat protein